MAQPDTLVSASVNNGRFSDKIRGYFATKAKRVAGVPLDGRVRAVTGLTPSVRVAPDCRRAQVKPGVLKLSRFFGGSSGAGTRRICESVGLGGPFRRSAPAVSLQQPVRAATATRLGPTSSAQRTTARRDCRSFAADGACRGGGNDGCRSRRARSPWTGRQGAALGATFTVARRAANRSNRRNLRTSAPVRSERDGVAATVGPSPWPSRPRWSPLRRRWCESSASAPPPGPS